MEPPLEKFSTQFFLFRMCLSTHILRRYKPVSLPNFWEPKHLPRSIAAH